MNNRYAVRYMMLIAIVTLCGGFIIGALPASILTDRIFVISMIVGFATAMMSCPLLILAAIDEGRE